MDKKILKKAEKLINEFFKKTSFDLNADVRQGEQREDGQGIVLRVEIQTEEPQVLIGERGRTLAEFQTILGRMLRKQIGEQIFVDLDINQYKKNKMAYLKDMANEIADSAALDKSEKTLFPMTSYERRVVHLELSERRDVKTESIGEEPDRRIVIKPA